MVLPCNNRLLFCFFALTGVACSQSHLGNYTSHSLNGNQALIRCGRSVVSIQAYAARMMKVRLEHPGQLADEPSFMVAAPAEDIQLLTMIDDSLALTLRAPDIEVVCQKFPFRMAFYSHGKLLTQERAQGGMGWDDAPLIHFTQTPDEHFYGFGQRAAGLDLKGKRFDTYNRANYGYQNSIETMNINIPFFVSSRGYGIFFDNSYPATFDLGKSDSKTCSYDAAGGVLTFYVIAGRTMKDVLVNYTHLTGRQPLPPRWALGYLQSKYGYENEAQTREVVNELRRRGFPVDGVILDLYWFGKASDMGALDWDRTRFPNPEKMIAGLKALGVQTILIHEPYFMKGLKNFDEAEALGFFGKDGRGKTITFPFWTGVDAALLDLTHPAAQNWLWEKLKPITDDGIGGWWSDLGEPEEHPTSMMHHLGSAAKVHNIFSLLWAKAIFENYRAHYPDARLFNLTRSGTAGMQRYAPFPWSGDVRRSFSGLALQLPIMLGMGMSGIAYQHSDIGGFAYGDPSTQPELYARWMQYGVFSPIVRAHGSGLPTEPYQFGEQVEKICRDYIKLRYRLLPYTYTYAYENTQTGLPFARPLALEYPDDPNVADLSSEYLWGEWLLVAPVVQANQRSKEVYLPGGEWFDYWTKKKYRGGKNITVDAPLERLPMFVKSGAILPMQNVAPSTSHTSPDTLALEVYPADSSAFTLYEDDGASQAYTRGEFALTAFACKTENKFVSVVWGKSAGNYQGKPQRRLYVMHMQNIQAMPDSIKHGAQKFFSFETRAALEAAGVGWWHDAANKQLVVQQGVETSADYDLQIFGIGLLTDAPKTK
jgi:alpha-glucosidase (family GH31 glycosyl hydrolase)